MKIADRTVVTFEYTLFDPQGNVLDSSEGHGPLPYLHGYGNIIPGLEKALLGKSAGEKMRVTIAAADAYGEHDEEDVIRIHRDQLQGEAEIGMRLDSESEDGMQTFTIVAIEGDDLILDANHPLAGVDLTFDVTVVAVREATPEEIQHEHVHGPDGHHHH